MAQNWFEQHAPKTGNWFEQHAPAAAAEPDFTTNEKGEGTYRMHPAEQQGYTDTSQQVMVPFSKVEQAKAAGYNLHPDEVPGYTKDFAHQGRGPTLWDRMSANLIANTEPLPDTPLEWNTGPRTVGSFVRSIPAALGNVEKMPLNVISRTGRGLAGLPSSTIQTVKDIHAGRPEGLEAIDPVAMAQHEAEGYQRDVETLGPSAALANVGGDVATMYLAGKAGELPAEVVRTPSVLRRMAKERFERTVAPAAVYAPGNVNIAGVDVPVGVGERPLQSADAARTYATLKRKGVDAPKFERFEKAQSEAVKNVIRKTAQETSGLTGPLQDEPADVVKDAAEVTFEKARPMYAALDKSLVPNTLKAASAITRRAIARARKLGVVIDDAPQQPVTSYVRTRSELAKMRRSSSDAALRYALGKEIDTMNADMDAALKNTPQMDNWKEADRLWSKGYALRSVADEIRKATRGTPEAEQAPGLAPAPTKLQGTTLVSRLNKLAIDGVLKKAFTPEEARNLRQAADILDRIQRVKVGKGEEGARGLAHVIGGAKGPLFAGGAGAAYGVMHGGLAGALAGAATAAGIVGGVSKLGLLLEAYGERVLVDVMTRRDGVAALRAVEAAKTPTQRQVAMRKLATVAAQYAAASSVTRQKKSLRELQAEAARRRPAGAQAPSQYDVVTGTSTPQ